MQILLYYYKVIYGNGITNSQTFHFNNICRFVVFTCFMICLNVQITLAKLNIHFISLFSNAANLLNAFPVIVKLHVLPFKIHLQAFHSGQKQKCCHLLSTNHHNQGNQ